MASSLESLSRISAISGLTSERKKFDDMGNISKWISSAHKNGIISLGTCLLAKRLAVETGLILDSHALAYIYLADCAHNIDPPPIEDWIEFFTYVSRKELELAVVDVLTALDGNILFFTPLDWVVSIRQHDYTVTGTEENKCGVLFLYLSHHSSYYRIEPDKLAAAGLFYIRLGVGTSSEPGLVLGKKEYHFIQQDLLPIMELIQGMIEELTPIHGEVGLTLPVGIGKRCLPEQMSRSTGDRDKAEPNRESRVKSVHMTQDPSTLLGSGVSGEVRRGRSGGSTVAVKIQKRTEASIRELAIMSVLSHPNILSMRSFSFEEYDGGSNLLIHMTVQSNSLNSLIYKSHTYDQSRSYHNSVWVRGNASPYKLIDLPTRRRFARQLLQGLVYLSDLRIIHGDIKPSNLLVSQAGILKIADFGLSIAYARDLHSVKETAILAYTPQYRDPNINKPKKIFSFEADVWASAMSILEMEVGILPESTQPNVCLDCIRDHTLARVCAQMLTRDINTRVNARQALVYFE